MCWDQKSASTSKLLPTLHCDPLACTLHSWWDNSLQMRQNWSQQPRFVWETGSRWCHQFILSLVMIMQTSQLTRQVQCLWMDMDAPTSTNDFLWRNPPQTLVNTKISLSNSHMNCSLNFHFLIFTWTSVECGVWMWSRWQCIYITFPSQDSLVFRGSQQKIQGLIFPFRIYPNENGNSASLLW